MARLLGKSLVWILLCVAAWGAGLVWYAGKIPPATNDITISADAIVVLTGSSGRIEMGLKLLAEGRGKALFISGAGQDTTVPDIVRQGSPAVRHVLAQRSPLPIFLGHAARNTIGNAEETALWIDERHYTRILLVTAEYHMPRSLAEFHEIMPEAKLIPVAVMTGEFSPQYWWSHAPSRALVLSEYHKFLAGKLRHWFVSFMRP